MNYHIIWIWKKTMRVSKNMTNFEMLHRSFQQSYTSYFWRVPFFNSPRFLPILHLVDDAFAAKKVVHSLIHVWFLVKKKYRNFFCLEKKFHEWLFKKIVLLIIARKNIVDSLFGHATTNTCFVIFQRTQWAKILKNKKYVYLRQI